MHIHNTLAADRNYKPWHCMRYLLKSYTCVYLWLQKSTHSLCMVCIAYFEEDLHQALDLCQVAVLRLPLLECFESLLRVGFLVCLNLFDVCLTEPQVRGSPSPVQEEGDAVEVLIRTLLVEQGQGNVNFFQQAIQCGRFHGCS